MLRNKGVARAIFGVVAVAIIVILGVTVHFFIPFFSLLAAVVFMLVYWLWKSRQKIKRSLEHPLTNGEMNEEEYTSLPVNAQPIQPYQANEPAAEMIVATNNTTTSTDSSRPYNSSRSRTRQHEDKVKHVLKNDTELAKWRVNAKQIQDLERIGYGAHGVVWRVLYKGTQILASKRVQNDHIDNGRMMDFIDEIKLISQFAHPNIAQFIGCAWTNEHDLQALVEYMEKGDLRQYLTNPDTSRDWNIEKLQIAIDIVEALIYMHTLPRPLVHRDFKSRNILLTSDLRAKLTDFGVSRFRSVDNTMTCGVGTSRWVAPEVIMGDKDYGPASDIYSFGVVLSELDTHNLPYDDARNAKADPLPNVAIIQKVASGTLKPSFQSTCPVGILELANQCLAYNPVDRPTATEVASALQNVLATFQSRRLSIFV